MRETWDPFEDMKKLRKRLFGENLNWEMPMDKNVRQPLVDIADKGDAIEVTAELPGAKKENIDVQVETDSIRISAKTSEKEEEEEKGFYYHERSYSSFSRLLPLPAEVVAEKAGAEFNNGILTITIPKKHPGKDESKGHKLEIK